jgi:hypothetical protein
MADDFVDFSFDVPAASPAPQENPSGSQINTADTASGSILSERRSSRGRPKGSRNRSSVGEGSERPLTPEEQRALEELFKPAQWRGLVRAPADAALFLTGSKTWELSAEETDQLAIGAANTARYFAPQHPKWLALSLFAMSVITIYGTHFVAWRLEQQRNRNVAPRGNVHPIDAAPKDGTLN